MAEYYEKGTKGKNSNAVEGSNFLLKTLEIEWCGWVNRNFSSFCASTIYKKSRNVTIGTNTNSHTPTIDKTCDPSRIISPIYSYLEKTILITHQRYF